MELGAWSEELPSCSQAALRPQRSAISFLATRISFLFAPDSSLLTQKAGRPAPKVSRAHDSGGIVGLPGLRAVTRVGPRTTMIGPGRPAGNPGSPPDITRRRMKSTLRPLPERNWLRWELCPKDRSFDSGTTSCRRAFVVPNDHEDTTAGGMLSRRQAGEHVEL